MISNASPQAQWRAMIARTGWPHGTNVADDKDTRMTSQAEPPYTVLPRHGLVLLVLLTLFWGVNWPIIKTALDEVPVLTFRALCLSGGAVSILLVSKLLGHSLRVPRHQWPALGLAAVFNISLWHVFSGYGVDLTTSGRAVIIGYTMPIWTVPLSVVFLRDRITWRRVLSLVLGTAGLAVLMVTDYTALAAAPAGALLMLGAAISWACGTVVQKRVAWEAPIPVLVGWQCAFGGIPIFLAAGLAVDYSTVGFPSLWPLLSVIYNIFIPFVFCYYAYYEVVRIFPVGVATIGMLATPIVGLFSGALLRAEPLGWAEYSALALVVLALALPIVSRPRGIVIGTG